MAHMLVATRRNGQWTTKVGDCMFIEHCTLNIHMLFLCVAPRPLRFIKNALFQLKRLAI
jgi:hypothetical protein